MSNKHKKAGVNYRKIYESHYGKIPKGYHIHHIDGDPFNNDIANLMCVTPEEHAEIHKNEFTKWASIGGKKGGELVRDLKLGIHGATDQQKSQWAKNASSFVHRKKFSITMKQKYASGEIKHWTSRYSSEEIHRLISQGDPGKSTRGKPAWNRGKKMTLSNPELARERKSIAAKNKRKTKCPHCEREIDISNIGNHIKFKHIEPI